MTGAEKQENQASVRAPEGESAAGVTEGERMAALLTDDRGNPDLLVFEKTWGHRLLAGVSTAMLIAAFVLVAYCAYQLVNLASLGLPNFFGTFGFMLYSAGIASGLVLVAPGVLGLRAAKRPRLATAAVVAPIIALALLAGLAAYALSIPGAQPFSVALYLGLASVFPLLYLVAAVKVKRA